MNHRSASAVLSLQTTACEARSCGKSGRICRGSTETRPRTRSPAACSCTPSPPRPALWYLGDESVGFLRFAVYGESASTRFYQGFRRFRPISNWHRSRTQTAHCPDAIDRDDATAKTLCHLASGSFGSRHSDTVLGSDRRRDRRIGETVDRQVGSTGRAFLEYWRASQPEDDSPTDLCD